jgi:SAM-dependent methyltransferase
MSQTHQEIAYDKAYAQADSTPFPDHKIEGSHTLTGRLIVSIGGGTGADVAHLAKSNQVYVVDYSAQSAPIARAFGLTPVTADLNLPDPQLPFSPGGVDVIVLKDVLEHLMEPEKLLQISLKYLKPDGYLVISVPNHLNLWGRIRVMFGGNLIWNGILHDHATEYSEWNYMHIRFFTWNGFKKLLGRNHLRIERRFFDFGPFGHYFSIPMYAEHLRMKRDLGRLTPKGKLFLSVGFPIYRAINFIFPERLRCWLCAIAPSVFTSCFYVHARKSQ